MMALKICFSEEIWIIIPKLSLLLLLIWSPAVRVDLISKSSFTQRSKCVNSCKFIKHYFQKEGGGLCIRAGAFIRIKMDSNVTLTFSPLRVWETAPCENL